VRSLAHALFLLVVQGFCACGGGSEKPADGAAGGPSAPSRGTAAASAIGKWTADAGATTLQLDAGGAFVMDTKKGQHVTGTWTLEGTKLTLTGGGEGAIAGTLGGTLEGDTLKLRMGPKDVVYERK